MRDLIFVTSTHRRPGRLELIRRHIRRFISQVDRYLWIVVEDAEATDPELALLLEGWNSVYLAIGPTQDDGGAQRNLALETIRDRKLDGIVYFLEDDNLVLPELAPELRGISKVGIVPIGNLGPNGVERPVVIGGRLQRWDSGWAERKYPVAKGGFAFDSRLIFEAPSPIWNWRGFGGETEFIDKLIGSPDELDLSACHGNQLCLVFHKEPLPQRADATSEARPTSPPAPRAEEMRVRPDLPLASQYALPARARLRVALIGCGWFACEAHIPALQRLEREGQVEIAALCSRSEASLTRARLRFGARTLKTYWRLEEALADPDIDLVDLVLPTPAMPDAIRAALRAGKAVISEKPCAADVGASLELFAEYGRLPRRPVWAVAENWRFKPTTKVLEEIVKGGEIGDVRFADFQFITNASPSFYLGWRGAADYPAGHLIDIGVHSVALLRQVVGEVNEVSAFVSQRLPQLPPADSLTSILTYDDGAEGAFQLSLAGSPADPRPPTLRLTGSRGSLQADLAANSIRLHANGRERLLTVQDDPWVQGGVYATLAHCIEAVRYEAPLQSSASEALRDLAVLEAMLQSGRTGQRVSAASLVPALHGTPRRVATFANAWSFQPAQAVECGSVAAVSAAVREAAKAGMRIRPMGTASSWAPEIATAGVSLATRRLNRIHGYDPRRGTISVETGARVGDITRALAIHGRALPSLPFNPNVTIGGAVATATHGTSPRQGSVSDFIASMKIVSASGDVRHLQPDTTPEELRAARVGVGAMGVTVELELETVAMPFVRLIELATTLDVFLAERRLILSRFDHVWGHWTLGDDRIHVECLETRPRPEKDFHPYVLGDGVSWLAMRRNLPPPSALTVTRGDPRRIWMSMQYAVPLTGIEGAVASLRASDFARSHTGRIVELKFLAGSDRAYLGPNSDGDVVLLNIWWLVDEAMKHTVFDGFEATMQGLSAKPHWGKLHRIPDAAYGRRAFGSWDAFEAVRSRLDPDGMFAFAPGADADQARNGGESLLGLCA